MEIENLTNKELEDMKVELSSQFEELKTEYINLSNEYNKAFITVSEQYNAVEDEIKKRLGVHHEG